MFCSLGCSVRWDVLFALIYEDARLIARAVAQGAGAG
jgi:hypothetical protein